MNQDLNPRGTEGAMRSAISVLFFGCTLLCSAGAKGLEQQNQPEQRQAKPGSATNKVWTNDDIAVLRETSPISVIGQAGSPTAPEAGATTANTNPPPATSKGPAAKEQDPAWYEQEIGSRREHIDQLNDQVLQIENARQTGQGISGTVPLDKTAVGITPEDAINALENQKNQLQGEIDDLQDQAQRNAISRDAWR